MSYKTVIESYQAEIEVKKSRFICNMTPIESEEAAAAFLQAMKKKYYDARHNCSAYIIVGKQDIERANDDGEPSQTAGMPMLDLLRSHGLKNVMVVVTRYFGGTLLGTGGLVRAYSDAVKATIDSAILYEKRQYCRIEIQGDYQLVGKLEYAFRQDTVFVEKVDYTELVVFTLLVPIEQMEQLEAKWVELTNGKINLSKMGTFYGYQHEERVIVQ